jgi:anthranilate phosphoribosyltransferase
VCCAGIEPSLAVAAIAAGAGARVAVHDGFARASTVATALGAGLDPSPVAAARSLGATGIGVFSEPARCPVWRQVRDAADAPALVAHATAHVVGAVDGEAAPELLSALCRLGVRRALAIPTDGERAFELCDGSVGEIDLAALSRGAAPAGAEASRRLSVAMAGEAAPVEVIAGLCIHAAWLAATPSAGVAAARTALASGAAERALDRFLAHASRSAPQRAA